MDSIRSRDVVYNYVHELENRPDLGIGLYNSCIDPRMAAGTQDPGYPTDRQSAFQPAAVKNFLLPRYGSDQHGFTFQPGTIT